MTFIYQIKRKPDFTFFFPFISSLSLASLSSLLSLPFPSLPLSSNMDEASSHSLEVAAIAREEEEREYRVCWQSERDDVDTLRRSCVSVKSIVFVRHGEVGVRTFA